MKRIVVKQEFEEVFWAVIGEGGEVERDGILTCDCDCDDRSGIYRALLLAIDDIATKEILGIISPLSTAIVARDALKCEYGRAYARAVKGRCVMYLKDGADKHSGVKENNPPMTDYKAYTDGACSVHTGKNGRAASIVFKGNKIYRKIVDETHEATTSNRMELTAIINAVDCVPDGSTISVFTDSKYCIKVLSNKFRITEVTKNKDLIETFRAVASSRKVYFKWVKGHSGNRYNEMADSLATGKTS